ELGELGDSPFQNEKQIEAKVSGIAAGRAGFMANDVTVHSTDRNIHMESARTGLRVLNKLDPNLATPQQLAANLILTGDFDPINFRFNEPPVNAYGAGFTMPARIPYIFGPVVFNGGVETVDNTTRNFAIGLRQ